MSLDRGGDTLLPPTADAPQPPPKIFSGVPGGIHRIDVNDPEQVFDLAVEVAKAPSRRLMQLNHAEMRAMARFAIDNAFVASHAVEIVVLSDVGASRDELIAALKELCKTARPFIGGAA